ncbi:GntR family transcriptional regulator [Xylocopilactobacillus apis]|uniref:GntR family transcriptional regulator n=1 Tax=Xylocopilactobacillus apis TaxID=2932183 RepID=A0AAU9DU58_9LACO|nr:GntR family transcriptional regulator [Xylocopilactobacillus apis]BDR57363.1 GntR family transcriptional regulator [Xylocopilactobacillus apis]
MRQYKMSLYEQIIDLLQDKITRKMQPDDKLPSERELSKTYGVSRNTIRLALDKLLRSGYIYRKRGQGTFVANQKEHLADLSSSYSFTEQMKSLGRVPNTELIYLASMEASKVLTESMNLSLGAPLYKLKRLRCADGIPMLIERTFLPAEIFQGLTSERLANHSLYSVMKRDYQIEIERADESFYASLINRKDAKRLNVPKGSPCLNVQRITYDRQHRIVEYTMSVARGDQFIYEVHHVNS